MFNTLSLESLERRVPSIFTEDSAARTSTKYQHISTAKIINGLREEGFYPTSARQCRTRQSSKIAHSKHILRFRHVDAKPTWNGLYPELVLINSHDGLSSYRLMSGIYRLVCSNGLIAWTSLNEVRVRHQGDILSDVINGTYRVIASAKEMLEIATQMSRVILNEEERLLLAEAAHQYRFENNEVGDAFKPSAFLAPRRYDDAKSYDLFTVFNILQENTIKGGIKGYARTPQGYIRRTSTRAINGIDQEVKLNKNLWRVAESMLTEKGQKAA